MDTHEYFAELSGEDREVLAQLRDVIQAAAPEAELGMSYGVPAFIIGGKPLVCFAAFKSHYGFYPLSPGVLSSFSAELAGFSTSKGTIRFAADAPLPTELVEKIVKARLEEMGVE